MAENEGKYKLAAYFQTLDKGIQEDYLLDLPANFLLLTPDQQEAILEGFFTIGRVDLALDRVSREFRNARETLERLRRDFGTT